MFSSDMKREKREIRKFHVVLGSSCSDGKEMNKKAWSSFFLSWYADALHKTFHLKKTSELKRRYLLSPIVTFVDRCRHKGLEAQTKHDLHKLDYIRVTCPILTRTTS